MHRYTGRYLALRLGQAQRPTLPEITAPPTVLLAAQPAPIVSPIGLLAMSQIPLQHSFTRHPPSALVAINTLALTFTFTFTAHHSLLFIHFPFTLLFARHDSAILSQSELAAWLGRPS